MKTSRTSKRFLVVLEVDEETARRAATKSNTRAVFRLPGSFCTELNHGKQRGYTKGRRFGWWVCYQCRKPSRVYWENVHENSTYGRNLKEELS